MTRPNNIRLRFTLLYGSALIATVIFFSAGVYFFVQKMLIGQIDNHLRKDITTITEYLRRDPAALDDINQFNLVHYFKILEHGHPLLTSDQWIEDGLENILPDHDPAPAPRSAKSSKNQRFRILSVVSPEGLTNWQVVVAHEEENYRRTLHTLGMIIMLIMPVFIAGSLAIGYLIAGRVLAPISAITRKAGAITAENLSQRLPVDASGDEMSQLAEVFNQTFERLEASFERLRRFTADASHELRTPLTAIRSIGETALRQPSGTFDCHETIGSILEETDRLAQTVEALLMLSRADSNAIEKEPTDIAALVKDAIEFLDVLAEEKEQKILFEQKCGLTIDADICLLRRAFLNLLDNAIKYSPPQSVITVLLYSPRPGETCIAFMDSGPGIPDDEKELIFNRFYRLDAGRSRNTGGTGLGLAITRAAIEAHGGSITLEDGPQGGAVFRIVFTTNHQETPHNP